MEVIQNTKTEDRIRYLDVLRTAATLAVILLHLFTAKDAITVTVNTNLHTGYTLKLQLEQLDDNGIYMDKGRQSTSLDNNQYRFELNDLVPDSYRILAIVEDEGGFAVLEAPYYFIIE